LPENGGVTIVTETLAEIVLDKIGDVVANDGARSSSLLPGRRIP
jgi:hypothetical protein